MTNDLKTRLYVTAIVVVMVTLYVIPFIVIQQYEDVRNALFQSCLTKIERAFDFCFSESRRNAELPLWNYLLPYIPTGAILWFNWLIKPDLRLNEESYPKRTMTSLLWIGLIVAAIGMWVPISVVLGREAADLYKIENITFWRGPWVGAAWVIPAMLFHHLVAPASFAGSMRKGKIALWLLVSTPLIAFALYFIRELIRDGGHLMPR